MMFCPLMRKACRDDCAWYADEKCAMAVIAEQARRIGDELYAAVEIMQGDRERFHTEGTEDGEEAQRAK